MRKTILLAVAVLAVAASRASADKICHFQSGGTYTITSSEFLTKLPRSVTEADWDGYAQDKKDAVCDSRYLASKIQSGARVTGSDLDNHPNWSASYFATSERSKAIAVLTKIMQGEWALSRLAPLFRS